MPSVRPSRVLGRTTAARTGAPTGRARDGARRVSARIGRLYGVTTLPEVGLLQPVAVHRGRAADLQVLAIGEGAPRSRSDGFALALARARADAILTTGRILRAEPGLDAAGPITASLARDLRAWRRQAGARLVPPVFAVLTSGRGFPGGHRLLRGESRVVVLVPPSGLSDLRAGVGSLRVHRPTPRGLASLRQRLLGLGHARSRVGRGAYRVPPVDVVVVPDLDAARAIEILRHGLRLGCVSLEAGPTTTRELRRRGIFPDEILLSVHEGRLAADATSAGTFPSMAALGRVFGAARSRTQRREGGGRWTFLRFARIQARVRQRRCAMAPPG